MLESMAISNVVTEAFVLALRCQQIPHTHAFPSAVSVSTLEPSVITTHHHKCRRGSCFCATLADCWTAVLELPL
jgi:flagellar biogenesis protein FliO